jgi:predicted dehydrogenase/threonine dehydrogenase-like Zn-dependent dehydrogenase
VLQVVQSLKSGETSLETVPVPALRLGHVLVKNHKSLVSIGTERMLVEFGKANLVQKARKQPDKVRQVLSKIKTDGLAPTMGAVMRKLDTPIPLGYSCAGEVIAVAEDVEEFKVGDRVVTNGSHAEVVLAPVNLLAKIPDGVSYEEASFTVVSSIGLQGIRLADPKFGETVVVLGLGLIGLISAQLLVASGCNVIGVDLSEDKLSLANSFGVKTVNASTSDAVKAVMSLTNEVGADAVIITASTESNDVIRQSAEMSRVRGKIVLVGAVGLNIDRSTFYHKELSFQVSCSYGPGRYDSAYEQLGQDYPIGYVRWTEKRNFEAILSALNLRQLNVDSLVSQRIKLADCEKSYQEISSGNAIATIIDYEASEEQRLKKTVQLNPSYSPTKGTLAVIGSGNFTQAGILPNLKKVNADVKYLVSAEGLSSTLLAKKFKIPYSSTSVDDVLADSALSGIIVSTRHDLHSELAIKALLADKHVFVEKPLALSLIELEDINTALSNSKGSVTVGFNRRFSPHVSKLKSLIGDTPGPVSIVCNMNAGAIPRSHWVHDLKVGGGRILGEACHHIDLASFIANSPIIEVCMQALGESPDLGTDNASILIKFKNGSQAVVNYFSNGSASYSKERIEVYSEGRNLVIDNFRTLSAYGFSRLKTSLRGSVALKTSQDKGHEKQFALFNKFIIEGGSPLIPFSQLENVTRATLMCLESLKQKSWISV